MEAKRGVVIAPLSHRPPCWRVCYDNGEPLFDVRLYLMTAEGRLHDCLFDIWEGG